jgi:hypothetical protein
MGVPLYQDVSINRGGIKPEKEGRSAELLFLHIAPYVMTNLPLPLSK